MQTTVQKSLLLLVLIIAAALGCTLANDNEAEEEEDYDLSDDQSTESSTTPGYNIQSIYTECNDTFITKMHFLVALNETGSFPDESDKTPFCFVRCFLHKSGIYDDDENVVSEQAVKVGWVDSEKTIDDCLTEMTGTPCQRAYYLVRCVTIHNLREKYSSN